MEEKENLEDLLKQSIAAQNRTTHAVRAFVRFLFIQLSFTTLAGFVFGISNSSVDPARCYAYGESCNNFVGIFFALMIWFVGLAVSSYVGWSELRKSEVPARNLDRLGPVSFSGRKSFDLDDHIADEGSEKPNSKLSKPGKPSPLFVQGGELPPLSIYDWEVLQRLTPEQQEAWSDAGSPNLQEWVAAGKPPFDAWITKEKKK